MGSGAAAWVGAGGVWGRAVMDVSSKVTAAVNMHKIVLRWRQRAGEAGLGGNRGAGGKSSGLRRQHIEGETFEHGLFRAVYAENHRGGWQSKGRAGVCGTNNLAQWPPVVNAGNASRDGAKNGFGFGQLGVETAAPRGVRGKAEQRT